MQVRQKNRWEKENNPKLLVGSAATQHVQVESRPGSIRALSLDEAFWHSFSSGQNVQNPEQKEKKKKKAAHSGVKKMSPSKPANCGSAKKRGMLAITREGRDRHLIQKYAEDRKRS